MPEGDTLYRTAETVRRWLGGRIISACRTTVAGIDASLVVGATVDAVESRGKHLLIHLRRPGEGKAPLVLRSHMRMNGTWHVYPAGVRWRIPAHEARIVLEAGDRLAVCFRAPTIELTTVHAAETRSTLSTLGPDVLVEPLDLDAIRTRARTKPPDTAVGELLLDQTVAAGIGNIYRNEALFVCRLHPFTPIGEIDDDRLERLYTTAAELLRRGAVGMARPTAVYGRAGRPCRRCAATVATRRQGALARSAFWCPACQPLAEAAPGDGRRDARPGGP